ncbi:MAG: hypothetical protein UU77_C0010G0027 [candidate division WWE3 bacterium GW2011_GWC1_41_7]|uniref:General secretion pathway protein G n=4 Tax=Katanobacteria TaxID=422282 RepID=A0A0G0ZI93_UNCKA|nr:MAG: hypothetical protein UU72_C0010G0026 [candidate division WWE3 bacterium GW2011_GWB1_41_6]KKS21003.1 MAG: hypothetical protein UU77_C0010G0027 [candidate division WWE3 bacterium GW2011_GWC1_41_7]KKS21756.1 MAG: hypothetical protein UU80_C0021G0027 [candidate division WWE3 bacterium GW2011_GWA1_41_8]OGC58030.1 MAG: hypothetical protein A2976_03980 [candidate division WWE3 bacterium RIFCSPLOWO2_01_FULL_41_9]
MKKSNINIIRPNNTLGFTLVELVVVVSLVAVLSTFTLQVINSGDKKRVSEDGVKQSNLQKLAIGIEAYYAGELPGDYPLTEAVAKSVVINYVENWPDGEPVNSFYEYVYVSAGKFVVYVIKSTDANLIYKYSSDWGLVKECSYINRANSDGCL